MKINPDSPEIRGRDATDRASKTGKAFEGTLAAKSQAAGKASGAEPLAGIADGLNKADLADPVKAQAAVEQAVREIMAKEFGGMCPPDREQVAAWLGSDPTMRDALLKRFISLAS